MEILVPGFELLSGDGGNFKGVHRGYDGLGQPGREVYAFGKGGSIIRISYGFTLA